MTKPIVDQLSRLLDLIDESKKKIVEEVVDEKSHTSMTIEEYEKEYNFSVKIIQGTNKKIKGMNIFPDLWREHEKGQDDDVSSKHKLLFTERPLRMILDLQLHYIKDSDKTEHYDVN